jgi:hypothetical protein
VVPLGSHLPVFFGSDYGIYHEDGEYEQQNGKKV